MEVLKNGTEIGLQNNNSRGSGTTGESAMKIYTHRSGERIEASVYLDVEGKYGVGEFCLPGEKGGRRLMTLTYLTLARLLLDVERAGYYVDTASANI